MGDLATTGGGPALAAAGLPRIVVLYGGETVEVRPPTVREALEILAALPGAVNGDPEDGALVEDVLVRWVGEKVMTDLAATTTRAMHSRVKDLLFQGCDLDVLRGQASATKKAEDQEEDQGPLDWGLLLSDYCQVWPSEPWTVYNTTPFPFFLAMLVRKDAATARDILRWVELETIPHIGKAANSVIGSLKTRARGVAPSKSSFGSYASAEVIKRDREALKAALNPKASA